MIQNPVIKAEYALVAIATTPKNEISHMHCTDFSWNKAKSLKFKDHYGGLIKDYNP